MSMDAQAAVVRYLKTLGDGAEVGVASVAARLGIAPADALLCLDQATAAGQLVRKTRNPHPRAPGFWSLPKVSA